MIPAARKYDKIGIRIDFSAKLLAVEESDQAP
jgi:hypothetical protein